MYYENWRDIFLENSNTVGMNGTYAIQYQNDIALDRLKAGYSTEAVIDNYFSNIIFEKSEDTDPEKEEKPKAGENILQKILKKIKDVIDRFIDAIGNFFSGKENLNADEYFQSSTAEIRIEKDIDKINKIVDDEIRKGSKLLQKISSATGVSDEEIDKYIQKGASTLKIVGPAVISSAVGWGFRTIFRKTFKQRRGVIDQCLDFTSDVLKKTEKQKNQQQRVLQHMNKLNNYSVKESNGFLGKLKSMVSKNKK